MARRPRGADVRASAPGTARIVAAAAVACLLSAGPLKGQVQPAGDVLTIDQATTLALQQNRSIQSNKLEVQKAEDSLAELRTRRRPALSLNFLEGRLLAPVDFQFPVGSFGVFERPARFLRSTQPSRHPRSSPRRCSSV